MTWSEKIGQHFQSAAKDVGDASRVLGVCLYGSQNYGLATENSDVDTKAFIMPSLSELIKYKKISHQIEADVDGGLCDLKHLELMCQNFSKQNINFLEILYTDYFICRADFNDAYQELRDKRDFLTSASPRRMLHASAGMAEQKYHALRHPYESKKDVLAKYGYDPKQLASMLRLLYFIDAYLKTEDFKTSITPEGDFKDLILATKAGSFTEDAAVNMAQNCMSRINKTIAETVNPRYSASGHHVEEAQEFLDDWVERTISDYLRRTFK